MRRTLSWVVLFALLSVTAEFASVTSAAAAVRTQTIDYRLGDAALQGYLAYDDALTGRRPGVLVVHEWWGLNDYVKWRAQQLARLGYVAFAPDIYGVGVRPRTAEEAGRTAGVYANNRALLRARAQAGLDVLRRQPQVDPRRLAAIGYCFGGAAVLELARSGADLVGVVSFHGVLSTPTPEDARNIKGKVLALHGADDPSVPPAQVAAFEAEMRNAKVDWEVDLYGGTVHSFTNPANGTDPSKGVAYNAQSDRRSWQRMRLFLAEVFGEPQGLIAAPSPPRPEAK